MNANEYKLKHGSALLVFLNTEAGKNLIPVLHQLRPVFTVNSNPHVHTESAGAVRGYELCEKNFLFLSTPPLPSGEVEMTYGTVEKT